MVVVVVVVVVAVAVALRLPLRQCFPPSLLVAVVLLLLLLLLLGDTRDACTVLIGSDFEEDRALRLVQQINEVKRAMAAGRVVVLVNHDQIYEAL